MPARQYAPKRQWAGNYGADGAMHNCLSMAATRRLVSSLIFNNTNTTVDARMTIWFGNSVPANNFGGIQITVPHRTSATYVSHANLTGLTMEPGWGIYYRVDSGGACTAEAHYMEEYTGASINYDPKSAWYGVSTSYTAALPVSAKRRIITSINGAATSGGDNSWYLWVGPTAPASGAYGLRWAGLNGAYATNAMSTLGVPLHCDVGDGLWAIADAANNYLQINYMEEQ